VSELYRLSDRSLSAKLVSTFTDRGCHVVSATDPYGRILGFLDRQPLTLFINLISSDWNLTMFLFFEIQFLLWLSWWNNGFWNSQEGIRICLVVVECYSNSNHAVYLLVGRFQLAQIFRCPFVFGAFNTTMRFWTHRIIQDRLWNTYAIRPRSILTMVYNIQDHRVSEYLTMDNVQKHSDSDIHDSCRIFWGGVALFQILNIKWCFINIFNTA
jgi:hypothetical protein